MSGDLPRPPRAPWRGTPMTVETMNRLRPVEARVYGMLAQYAATRTRASLTLLGRIQDDRGVPLGATAARRIVSDLHDQGLLLCADWVKLTNDSPMTVYLSGMEAPARMPRHLRLGEDRIRVGGRFTAPRTLPRDLLDELIATGHLLKEHNEVPADERDSRWIENLAVYTEARAAAFHQWASIDAARIVQAEAHRLTTAAQAIRSQAANRAAAEQRKHGKQAS